MEGKARVFFVAQLSCWTWQNPWTCGMLGSKQSKWLASASRRPLDEKRSDVSDGGFVQINGTSQCHCNSRLEHTWSWAMTIYMILWYQITLVQLFAINLSELHSGLSTSKTNTKSHGIFSKNPSPTARPSRRHAARPCRLTCQGYLAAEVWCSEDHDRVAWRVDSTPGGSAVTKTHGVFARHPWAQSCDSRERCLLVFFCEVVWKSKGPSFFFSKSFESFWKVVCGCFQQ